LIVVKHLDVGGEIDNRLERNTGRLIIWCHRPHASTTDESNGEHIRHPSTTGKPFLVGLFGLPHPRLEGKVTIDEKLCTAVYNGSLLSAVV
jgi:hypothetical protein